MTDEQLKLILEAIKNQHQCIMQSELEELKKKLALVEIIRTIFTPKMILTLTICITMILNFIKGV